MKACDAPSSIFGNRLSRHRVGGHIITDRGVSVRFINERLDFDACKELSPMAKLMLSMVGAFAEFERSMIKRRQAEGLALAKARSVYKGRQRSGTDAQIEEIRSKMEMGVPLSLAARKVGISRTTAYRYLTIPVQ